MEIDPKLRIIVGVLTLVLAGGAMWMGSGQLDARPGGGEFKVLFLESVEGLSRNSPVTYKGRLVGKVLKISQAKKEDGIYTLVRFGLDANVEVYEQRIEIETVLFKPEGLEDWFAANDVILAVGKKEVDTVRSFTQTLDQWLDDLRLSRSAAPHQEERM